MKDQFLYSPREDSKLLRDAISLLGSGERFLEIGCGTTVNLRGLSAEYSLVVGTDLHSIAVMKELKRKADFELIISDKATCFREGVFDVVAFNPPYLPSKDIMDWAVDGGVKGLEVPLSFLSEAIRVGKEDVQILLILSSENDLDAFNEFCNKNNVSHTILLEKPLFFEKLYAVIVQKTIQ